MESIFTNRKKRAAQIIKTLKKLFPSPKIALNYKTHWQLFVAVVLSAQCTDKKVNEVTSGLFRKYHTLDDYVRASRTKRGIRGFENDIKPTGFYHNKAKNILSAAKAVKEKFDGKLPRAMNEMLTIPGIGRKSANVILGNAYGVVEGIAVDTHVRRLARMLGLTGHTDPNKIEKDLMRIVPKKEWFAITYRLIDYGRRYCPARAHDHKGRKCPFARWYVI